MGKAEKVNTKEPSEKKKKSKKAKELGAGEAEDTQREAQEPAAGSSRVLVEDKSAADEAPKEKKKKKRKAKEESAEEREDNPAPKDEDEPKRKKKSKGKEREVETTAVAEEDVKVKKSKKRKDRKDEAVPGTTNEEDRSRKKKKRKKESKSGLPDPEGDETLSEQAKKALSYAYLQAEDPSSWKFNKARQNWLLRNVWSEESIPDTYVPLANKYLAGVQGGVRETLIKTCQEIIAMRPVEEPAPTGPEAEEDGTKKSVKFDVPEANDKTNPAAATLSMKQKRARGLLDVLQSS